MALTIRPDDEMKKCMDDIANEYYIKTKAGVVDYAVKSHMDFLLQIKELKKLLDDSQKELLTIQDLLSRKTQYESEIDEVNVLIDDYLNKLYTDSIS